MMPHECDYFHAMLFEFVDGGLEPILKVEMERHLEMCSKCQTFHATYITTITFMKSLPRNCPLPEGLEQRLEKLINQAG
jgi:anti-sigma factor RsiW